MRRINGAAVGQRAVGIDHHITGRRAQRPGVMHTDAGFSTHQANFVGIHTTKLRNVNGKLWADTAVIRFFVNALVRGIDLITPGRHVQFLRPDTCVHFNGAGNQISTVLLAAIQPVALNNNFAPVNVVSRQLTITHLHLTGGQRGAVRVNKAAAVTGNARGVGNHHLRLSPGDFNKAVQLAGVACIHFIENDLRFALCQPRIAVNHSGNLRLGVGV